MTDKIDWNQPVELMDGTPCEIDASSSGPFRVFVRVVEDGDHELRAVTDTYGRIGGVQVVRNREKKVVFLNFYEGSHRAVCHASKTEADLVASDCRTACIRVEYFIGEGLGESADD